MPLPTRSGSSGRSCAAGALLDLGVYPINFAFALFGTGGRVGGFVLREGPVGGRYAGEHHLPLRRRPHGRTLRHGLLCHRPAGHRLGRWGYLVVDNINDSCTAEVYDTSHRLVARHVCPPKLTGFE